MSFGPNSQQKQLNNILHGNAESGAQGSQQARDTGMGFLNRFSSTLEAPTNYFSRLLSGDKTLMSQAVAPTAKAMSSQYDQAARAVRQNTPRGGYASTLLSELPFQKAANVSNLFSTLQPAAAQGLTGIGGMYGQTGGNLMNTGASYLNAGTGAAGTAEDAIARQRQAAMQSWMGIGQLAGGILTAPLTGGTSLLGSLGSIFKPKSSMGST